MFETHLKELFEKVRTGDREAFALIYNELKQPVFTIVYRIVQSKEVSEDITHDVFVKLFVSPPDSSVKNPRAWIFQMARNRSIDTLRKKKFVNSDDASVNATDDLGHIAVRLDIESAIQKLSCIEREVLSLHLTAGLHFNEISGIVSLSMPATYRLYRKALKNLQVILEGGSL